jgi:hypothetical protein
MANPDCERCAQLARGLARLEARLNEQAVRQRALERALREKDARIEALEKRNAELETRVHRAAAPFRRAPAERQRDPRPPGRPPGHPPAFRPAPAGPLETEIVPLATCPHCHGPVEPGRRVEQVIEEIPPVAPVVKRIVTYEGHCPQCGVVRSTHPWQRSTARGAAGVQLGPRAVALAASLRHGHGLTLRRTAAVLRDHFHLSVSHAGLYQALARLAQKAAPAYQELAEELRQSASVHADETGWWLENRGAWLWVVTDPRTTVYHISRKRNAAALATVLGERFDGVLVSDCLRVYDQYEAAAKSKCMAHHLRRVAEAEAQHPGSAFLARLRRLLGASLRLKGWAGRLPAPVYERGVASLERRLTALLAPTYPTREEERIAQRLRNQREHVFTFLSHDGVAATNNLAERQLRPAVITRKLSSGNESEAGARVWEVLASLAATCRQRGNDFVALVVGCLRSDAAPSGLSPPCSGAAS